jgi:hypothetical protein
VHDKTVELIEQARKVAEQTHPTTVRHVFYALVAREVIANCLAGYRCVSRVLTLARKKGLIPWEWIEDRNRPRYAPGRWANAEKIISAALEQYRRNYWQDQRCYCEIWSEKDTVLGALGELARELGIHLAIGRGFGSTSGARKTANIFREAGKAICVFYVGDHDASGALMELDFAKRVEEYSDGELRQRVWGDGLRPGEFAVKRLAIHKADIKAFNLPPQNVKSEDPRAEWFKKKFGKQCVELEALPVEELRTRISSAVNALIDWAAWERAINVEQAEFESIRIIQARMGKYGLGGLAE